MANTLLLLSYLLYLSPNVGLNVDLQTANAFLFENGASLNSRVYNQNVATNDDINQVIAYLNGKPFSWFVDNADADNVAQLVSFGLIKSGQYYAMQLDLTSLVVATANTDFVIQKFNLDNDALAAQWIDCVTTSFKNSQHIINKPGLIDLLAKFKASGSRALSFYLGMYQGQVSSACMAINHGSVVSLHWVATLQDARGQGLATLIAQQALQDAQKAGCSQAILLASLKGKVLYENMGFVQYATYDTYRQ